jgi:hypothetical protein
MAHASDTAALEAALRIGGATSPTGAPNPIAFDAGGRLGVTFSRIYMGLSFMDSPGTTADTACVGPVVVACTTSTIKVSAHSVRFGADGGYDIALSERLTLRPTLSIGVASLYEFSTVQIVVDGALTSLDGSTNTLYVEPGATALFAFGPIFVGADLDAVFLPTHHDSTAGLAAHGQAGLRF